MPAPALSAAPPRDAHTAADTLDVSVCIANWNCAPLLRKCLRSLFENPTPAGASTNDEKTAADNYWAIQQFFLRFPHLKPNDFYISAESYRGSGHEGRVLARSRPLAVSLARLFRTFAEHEVAVPA